MIEHNRRLQLNIISIGGHIHNFLIDIGILGLTVFLRPLYIELLTHLIRFTNSISI